MQTMHKCKNLVKMSVMIPITMKKQSKRLENVLVEMSLKTSFKMVTLITMNMGMKELVMMSVKMSMRMKMSFIGLHEIISEDVNGDSNDIFIDYIANETFDETKSTLPKKKLER